MKKFDPIESSDQIISDSMVQIWNLKYSKHFWIIKCIGLEPIIFAINLDTSSL